MKVEKKKSFYIFGYMLELHKNMAIWKLLVFFVFFFFFFFFEIWQIGVIFSMVIFLYKLKSYFSGQNLAK